MWVVAAISVLLQSFGKFGALDIGAYCIVLHIKLHS